MPVLQSSVQQNSNATHTTLHSRLMCQPPIFNMDSLPPLNPCSYRDPSSPYMLDPVSGDLSMKDQEGSYALPSLSPHNPPPIFPSGRRSQNQMSDGLPLEKDIDEPTTIILLHLCLDPSLCPEISNKDSRAHWRQHLLKELLR